MMKNKNAMHSNLFFGTVLFLGLLLTTWGCSKNVVPPEVEEPPAPVVEAIPEPEPQPEIDVSQEQVEGIQEVDEAFQGGGFETSSPEVLEEVDVVEVVPPAPEPEPVPEFVPAEPEPEMTEAPPVMDMTNDVFVAPEAEVTPEPEDFVVPEAEPVQEARVLPDFKDEQHLQDIHFEYDRDSLDSQTKDILKSNAEWLKKNPNARVEIQGHADERGTNNYNLGLGERRALQTKKYLVTLGIDESRLYTISYGEEKPFCFDSNENCWWENRRAHFTVAD